MENRGFVLQYAKNNYFCDDIKAIKMRDVDYIEEQGIDEVKDYAPMTSEEACRRIEEAERGIANGEVVLHSEVMRHSYEMLEKYAC